MTQVLDKPAEAKFPFLGLLHRAPFVPEIDVRPYIESELEQDTQDKFETARQKLSTALWHIMRRHGSVWEGWISHERIDLVEIQDPETHQWKCIKSAGFDKHPLKGVEVKDDLQDLLSVLKPASRINKIANATSEMANVVEFGDSCFRISTQFQTYDRICLSLYFIFFC
jgi:hypothetical protein